MNRPVRIETGGSIFEIDEDMDRYRRFPKNEGPREKPEWSDERAGALQDAVWHPFVKWGYRSGRLVIQVEEADENGMAAVVTAPLPLSNPNAWLDSWGDSDDD